VETDGLGCSLREEVSGQEVSCNTSIKTCIAVVGSIYNGILEASWILEIQVDLASLRLVGLGGLGTNVGLE